MNKGKDCFLFFCLRLKLILRDKITIGLFAAAFLSLLFMTGSLFQSAEEKSKIPIGVIDLDNTKMSKNFVQRIKKNRELYVIEGEQEGKKEWKNQNVEGLFVIEENYEKRVLSGNTMEIVSFYYLKENTLSPFLIDVLGGEMMFDICLSKGMNLYYNLEEGVLAETKLYTEEEYINYINKLALDSKFIFTFDMETVDTEAADNSLLYIQITFVILLMFLAFILLFMMCNVMIEKEQGIALRLRTCNLKNSSKNMGDILAVMAVNLVLNLLFVCILFFTLPPFSFKTIGTIYIVFMLYSMEYSIIFFLLSKIVQSISAYITAGSFFVILSGFSGFFPVLDGIVNLEILKFFEFFPNSWFIKWITDIIT